MKDRGKYIHDLTYNDWLPCKYGWLNLAKARHVYDRATLATKEWRYIKQGVLPCDHVYNFGDKKWVKAIVVYSSNLTIVV